jgi:hypothetical protein
MMLSPCGAKGFNLGIEKTRDAANLYGRHAAAISRTSTGPAGAIQAKDSLARSADHMNMCGAMVSGIDDDTVSVESGDCWHAP